MSLVSPSIDPNFPTPNRAWRTGRSSTPSDDRKPHMSELEKKRKGGFWFRRWDSVDMANLCWTIVTHALATCAPLVFNWGAFMVFLVLAFFTGLGVTLGYHRLLTHHSFKLPTWLEYFFAYCGAQAGQRDPIVWVSTHKIHHKHADTDRDLHSPLEGFCFSHIGWLFYHDDIASKCGESGTGLYSNVPELKAQWFYRFLHDTYFCHPIALASLLYLHGGFPYLAWGMGMRIVIVCHITFIIRSVGHIWGERPWNTPDNSTNNWWLGLVGFGEGWHNNHHAFPKSAQNGFEWWEFDLTWEVIKFLKLVGLATDVKTPSEADKRRMELWCSTQTNKLISSLDDDS